VQHVIETIRAMSAYEIAATLLAVAYLVLVIRENVWCWPAALASTLLSMIVFYDARLYMEYALQYFYAAMAVFGWYQWKYGGRRHAGLAISVWSWRRHAIAIAAIGALSVAFGAVLSARTQAANPFIDSFTTVGALVTTYMVTKKVLENWVYWLVIDSVTVYLYCLRELWAFAALFVLYLVLVVVGFKAWIRQWQAEQATGAVA
jgi:nicotinamide mononucleotide transporter